MKKIIKDYSIFVTTALGTFGLMFSNVDNAPINMSGLEISQCIGTFDSIKSKLFSHYQAEFLKQIYKIFGSLNIIGNPLNLIRSISTGVKDLVVKPAKGLSRGPAQFGIGIVKGTRSLVTHSVGGVFNSVSKITETVSNGLAVLAFDK